jgi:hypothetical protein
MPVTQWQSTASGRALLLQNLHDAALVGASDPYQTMHVEEFAAMYARVRVTAVPGGKALNGAPGEEP